eukprot:TRINITY_DN2977_c0_g1_i1.p1 TRINITY_DN2977_c0_g1~~TRINITY_DN2977_c0_g1_i1.p1  ORF type:complete len:222 (-),score=45.49 TRINITY_DN2977_c0_g1_i1:724-1389(-)
MQFTVSKPPSVVSRGCTKCRVCKVQRNVVGHTKQDKQFVSSKDAVSNAVLGLTLSATILTNCGAVLAEEYADEMFKIVQERSGPPLEVQEAPVVSEREKRFQKLREELVEEESVSKATAKSSGSSSPFAAEDGTFKSAGQVQIAGAIAIAGVIGGVLYTNSKKGETTTPVTPSSTPTPSQNGVKDAEAWVANWKSGGSSNNLSAVEEAEAWVQNWKAKSNK